MTFADWVVGGNSPEGVLDTGTKHSGNSSFRGRSLGALGQYTTLTHNTFSASSAQIILWVYSTQEGITNYYNTIALSTYGNMELMYATTTWIRFRVSFWYDIVLDTKWGRVEYWSGSAWVQIGGDTNFGTGSPAAGSLVLTANNWGSTQYCWFDELEVYI